MPFSCAATRLLGMTGLVALLLAFVPKASAEGNDTPPAAPSPPAAAAPSPSGAAGPDASPEKPPMAWVLRPTLPKPDSPLARKAAVAMSKEIDLSIEAELPKFAARVAEESGVPVSVDARGVQFARLEPNVVVSVAPGAVPLRTALRLALRPLGLRAVVGNHGLVITADYATLAHRGIGTDRWLNVDEAFAREMLRKLNERSSVALENVPLHAAIERLAADYNVPLRLDIRGIEDLGLTGDVPVTLWADDVKLDSALSRILRKLDLDVTLDGESLTITSFDASEDDFDLMRIYWLEGIGFAPENLSPLLVLIEASISPDTWESVGGLSTMTPVLSSRPAILVRAPLRVHRDIGQLMEALRAANLDVDPRLEKVQVPAPGWGAIHGTMGGLPGVGMGGMSTNPQHGWYRGGFFRID